MHRGSIFEYNLYAVYTGSQLNTTLLYWGLGLASAGKKKIDTRI